MEFWDTISKTVSEAADYTAREATRLTRIAKLKYKLAMLKARLDTLFAKLGRVKYDELKGTASSDTAAYDDLITKIDNIKEEITKIEDELAKLKNVRICASCRSVIGLDMAFCPRCGAKQPEPEVTDDSCDCSDCCETEDSDCCDDEDCCCCCDDEDCDCTAEDCCDEADCCCDDTACECGEDDCACDCSCDDDAGN